MTELRELLGDWERWSAELLESHISYPFLVYFRSQHTDQSWLAALTAILDTCALVIACVDEIPARQAQRTFAMARHAVVELTQYFIPSAPELAPDRLPSSSFIVLRKTLAEADVSMRAGTATEQKLSELRAMYEPYVQALGKYLLIPMPPWFRISETPDSWQMSNWQALIPTLATESSAIPESRVLLTESITANTL